MVPGSGRPLTFNGSPSATIPAGALVVSDPVDLKVPPLVDLAVSVFLPCKMPEDFRLTGHSNGHQTNYISPPGDFASANDLPIQEAIDAFLFLSDVLAQPGVTHVIVLIGVNDLRNSRGKSDEVVTAEAMIAGLNQLVVRAHARGLKIFGGTLLPWENDRFNGGFYTAEGEVKRQAVNAWIRESGIFDAVIDFKAALRDESHKTRMLPEWDSGDHLHPSDPGYLRMGDSIDLALFD